MKLGVCSLLPGTQHHSLVSFWTNKTTKCGFISFCSDIYELSQYSRGWISDINNPELPRRCGELRLGPENAPNFCSASGRRDGGSRLQKPVFGTIFRISPFWNPPCIPIYPSYISNPDGCESRESQLSESFGHFKIGWKMSDGSFVKDHLASWGAYWGTFGDSNLSWEWARA